MKQLLRAFGTNAETQGVQFDKPFSVGLIVGPFVVFKGGNPLVKQ
jgi:hypothetical protein